MIQLAAAPIDPRQPISAQIHEILRRSIITMRLRPKEKLSESELALALGVSRTPVREALIKLSEDGLVEILPQRGGEVSHSMDARAGGLRHGQQAPRFDAQRRGNNWWNRWCGGLLKRSGSLRVGIPIVAA